ncbi:uncharacterized protein [Haliotis asinina]|uniref:uncharacterized protein n=1 Tax=Haliotis asinina TaxID=109174 RepID=UPI003531B2A4
MSRTKRVPRPIENASKRLVRKPRPWYSRPPPSKKGLYSVMKDKRPIYVGRSCDIRRRLNQHFSGSSQAIDRYLRTKSNSYLQRHIQVSWVQDKRNKCHEQSVMKGVERNQKRRLTYNKRAGDSC